MERLHFACPHTRQDIDVGIDSELNTLLRIRNNTSSPAARFAASVTNGRSVKRDCFKPRERPANGSELLLLWAGHPPPDAGARPRFPAC